MSEPLEPVERALVLADAPELSRLLQADPTVATAPLDGVPPLNVLLRRSSGSSAEVRGCARLLLERGAIKDDDAFYHACERSDTALLDLLYEPGYEAMVNHKLDFEDAAGVRWFLDRGVDVDAHRCLHHAIARGRGVGILTMLLDAGADPDLPWDRWDVGRRPLALAARCGHLAASASGRRPTSQRSHGRFTSAPASSSIVRIFTPRPRLIAWWRQRWASTSTPRSRNHCRPAASSKSSLWLTIAS